MCVYVHMYFFFSCSVMSDSLWPHGLQHSRLPCPSLFSGVCSKKASFFMVHLSHPYMTAEKTLWTFVSKVISLLFNMLSRFIIAFLARSKCLSVVWLQSPSAVILEPKKIKYLTVSIVSPSISHGATHLHTYCTFRGGHEAEIYCVL